MDPFNDTEVFRYARHDIGFVVYRFGRNLIEDGNSKCNDELGGLAERLDLIAG